MSRRIGELVRNISRRKSNRFRCLLQADRNKEHAAVTTVRYEKSNREWNVVMVIPCLRCYCCLLSHPAFFGMCSRY